MSAFSLRRSIDPIAFEKLSPRLVQDVVALIAFPIGTAAVVQGVFEPKVPRNFLLFVAQASEERAVFPDPLRFHQSVHKVRGYCRWRVEAPETGEKMRLCLTPISGSERGWQSNIGALPAQNGLTEAHAFRRTGRFATCIALGTSPRAVADVLPVGKVYMSLLICAGNIFFIARPVPPPPPAAKQLVACTPRTGQKVSTISKIARCRRHCTVSSEGRREMRPASVAPSSATTAEAQWSSPCSTVAYPGTH
jgi:hypothetical protein